MRTSAVFRTILVVMAVLAGATLASASDLPLDGRRMLVRNDAAPARSQTFVKLADRRVELTGVDPTLTGAEAAIGRPGGTPLVLDLPANGWRRGSGPRLDFRYRNTTGPLRSARLVQGKFVRLWIRGPGAYELDGVPQGTVDIVLTVGDARFCGSFGGKIRRDDGRRFFAAFAPAPVTCPEVGGTPVPSTVTPTPEPTPPAPTVTATPNATEPAPTATSTPETTSTPIVTATPEESPPPPTTTATPAATAPPPTETATPEPTATVTPTASASPTATSTPCIGMQCPGCTDGDGDGAGIGADCAVVDCDDADPDVHPGAAELCNSRDDDCDTLVDEGFDLQSDEQNCGSCGSACALSQATASCVGGTCTVASCASGWSNADGVNDNGCECAKNEATANDVSTSALYLGNLPDSGATATSQLRIVPWSAAEGFDVDWFRIDAADDFVDDFSFVVTLSGLPANNYRVTVYRGAPPGSGDTYACGFLCLSTCRYPASKQATSNGAASVTVTLDEGSVCSDDGGTFYVSVEQLSGSPACVNLTLTARNV